MKTFEEYSLEAASSFLQTAVFIDDNIYQKSDINVRKVTRKSRKQTGSTAASKKKEVKKDAEQSDKSEGIEGNGMFDAYEIVNSFAKKQIVCSLYQPRKDASVSPKSDLFPLCKAADLVIIDWDLYGDDGKKASELISGLISQAVNDLPEQLRLIIIYTQEIDLFGKLNEVYERLQSDVQEKVEAPKSAGELAFHANNIRVRILGKTGSRRPKSREKDEVAERDLPDAAIKEFAQLASGLLQSATLMGLAAIRNNSRKIVSRFSQKLEQAYLTHKVMLRPDVDPSEHLIPLLKDEIEAVLQDVLPSPLLSQALLKDWCEKSWNPGRHLKETFGDHSFKNEVPKLIDDRLPDGREPAGVFGKVSSERAKNRKLAKIFPPSPNLNQDFELAFLMSVRSFYGEAVRRMTLGTILFDLKDNVYLLCLQPVCDSVRVEGVRDFFFLKMSINTDPKKKFTHIVFDVDRNPVELVFEPKVYNSVSFPFSPTSKSQTVEAQRTDEGTLLFASSSRKFRWVCQLKPDHAQRAIEKFGRELTRIGLTESEWMRKLS